MATARRITARLDRLPVKPWQAYACAIVVTAATIAVRLLLQPSLDGQPALMIFVVPILVSAYVGGIRGGMLATLLAAIASNYFFLPPLNSFRLSQGPELWQETFLLLSGAGMSIAMGALHRAVTRARTIDEALRHSEARYRALIDWSPDAVAVHRNGHVIFVNPSAVRLFGASHHTDLLGKPMLGFIPPEFHQVALERMRASSEHGVSAARLQMELIALDGSRRDVEVEGTAIVYDGAPALLASLRDVSERREHEVEIERLNHMYAALSEVNQAIVRMPSREDLFKSVCQTLVEHGGFRMAWIGWHDPDTRTLVPVAVCGDDDDYLQYIRVHTDDRPEGRGPSGTAFREARSYVCNDLRSDPAMAPWRSEIDKRGFNASAAFPIRLGGAVAGVLTVCSHEAHFFKDREVALLDEAAHDISFALDNVAREVKRQEAEGALLLARDLSAQAEREFRALFAANPLAMWIYDLETLRFLEVNDAAIERYGYSRDEFLAMTIKDIRPAEDVPRLLENIARPRGAWQGAGTWRHQCKGGPLIDVDITSHVIAFAGRSAALVVAQDITERLRAIEALRVGEERMRFALQSANVGIWDMDFTTGKLAWSEIMEAQYGLATGTFDGRFETLIALSHPAGRAAFLASINHAIQTGGDFANVNRSRWADGTVHVLNGSGRVVLDDRGKAVRAVGISIDVTERRTLEEQFHQAQKMEAVGRLAGGVAHDFNNLLTVILGFCELLRADMDAADPHRDDLGEIHKAGVSAAALTRQLLAFSRKEIIEPTVVDLNEVVAGLRAMLERLIGEDVAIRMELPPDVGMVMADRGQLEQVIVNLCINARDAMPMGGTLTIETADVELDRDYARTHLDVNPGNYVRLTVSDTGMGIEPAVQARLFEPFFTTKERGSGTGLGLATIHGIVANSGGSVTVYSEVGMGTSFKVYLPRTNLTATPTDATPQGAPPRRGSQTVLLVEDADALRELARRMLERHGYRVLAAADAEEATQLFEQEPSIDVLLTDVVMPGASGPELALRLTSKRPSLKVIYMSGYTDEAIVHHGVLNPGVALLNKPFTSDALVRKIREALDTNGRK